MRAGIVVNVTPEDRQPLRAMGPFPATAKGRGAAEVPRQSRKSTRARRTSTISRGGRIGPRTALKCKQIFCPWVDRLRAAAGAGYDPDPLVARRRHDPCASTGSPATPNDYVSKPFDAGELLAVVAGWTGVAPIRTHRASAAAKTEPPPILNESRPAELARIMPPNAFEELVRSWMSASAARLDRIDSAIAAGDLGRPQQDAHDLASSSGNMGASRMEAQARSLEHACRAGDIAGARALAIELRAALRPSLDAVAGRFLVRAPVPSSA